MLIIIIILRINEIDNDNNSNNNSNNDNNNNINRGNQRFQTRISKHFRDHSESNLRKVSSQIKLEPLSKQKLHETFP